MYVWVNAKLHAMCDYCYERSADIDVELDCRCTRTRRQFRDQAQRTIAKQQARLTRFLRT